MFTATRLRCFAGFAAVPVLGALLLATPAAAAAGRLDPSFGVGGKVTTDFVGTDEDTRGGLALDAHGRITAVGATVRFVAGEQTWDFAVAHYLPDGTPDAAFGNGGRVSTDFGTRSDVDFDAAYAVAVQRDGKVIATGVSGLTDDVDSFDWTLARYNLDGTLDTSFGGDGTVTTDFRGAGDWAQGVSVQPDGRIVVAGSAGISGLPDPDASDFAVARYNSDGTLDTSFGSGGKVITPFPNHSAGFWDVKLQRDGRIVATGSATTPDDPADFAVARYNTNGTLDTSFSGGLVTTALTDGYDEPRRAAVQPDGKIVVAGGTGEVPNNTTLGAFAMARYNADGTLDRHFGDGGKVITNLSPGADEAFGLTLQPDGRILLAGGKNYPSNGRGVGDFALVRYNTDGTPDRSFGPRGLVTTDFTGGDDNLFGVVIQDGRILVAGVATNPGTGRDFALARYLG